MTIKIAQLNYRGKIIEYKSPLGIYLDEKNIGIRCAHYLEVNRKSLRRDLLDEQDKLCLICRGVDSKNCDLYFSLCDLEDFNRLFYKEKNE